MICNSTTTKTSKHHSCSLNHKHTGNLISFLTWLSATRKLQSISTSAKIFQIHLPTLTQIVTQVCAKACGRSGQIAVKFRIFCWRNGRIVLKIARNHEPIAAGSHEVSGSIPLISTKTKSHSVRNGFFVLAGHTWREKRCGSTECIFAAQKRRFFCMQCRKHKKMQSARSKRSLRSIPLIVPLSFLEKRMHFCSHATWPRFDPNGCENAVDLLRFIWQNSTNISWTI